METVYPRPAGDVMLRDITLSSYYLSQIRKFQRPKLLDKGPRARNRNPLKLVRSVTRGVYYKYIRESPWNHLQEASLTPPDPWFLAPAFLCMFVPLPSLQTSFLHKVLVSVFPCFQYERTLPSRGHDWGCRTVPQLSTLSPHTEGRQLGSSRIQYLIPLPISTKFSTFFWHFLLLLSFERLPASRDLANVYHHPLPRAILVG